MQEISEGKDKSIRRKMMKKKSLNEVIKLSDEQKK